MRESTDYLAEHGFVETKCHECHESVVLPQELYQKYIVYYCAMCEPQQSIWERLWAKHKLAIVLGGGVGPLALGSILGLGGLFLGAWTVAGVGAAILMVWCSIAILGLLTVGIIDIVKNPGSY